MSQDNDARKVKRIDIKWIIGTIIAIVALFPVLYDSYSAHKRDIRITDVQFYGSSIPNIPEGGLSHEYAWGFLNVFSNDTVQFHVENHSEFDIEVYAFYVEVQVENLIGDTFMIPLETSFKGTDQTVSSYLSDWQITSDIDKYILPSQTTSIAYSNVGETISGGPAIWFLDSVLCDESNPVPERIQSALSSGERLSFECRVVCKDTFNNLYHSKWFKFTTS